MTYDDTQLVTVDCPHKGCENRSTALVPEGATVVGTTTGDDDCSAATGKVRTDCSDHLFYVHFED